MSTGITRRRRESERRIFFAWETRRTRLTVFTRRHLRIVALALLAGTAAWVVTEVEARHRATHATRATIATVMQAAEAFRSDHEGRCPPTLGDLVNPSDGHESYLPRVPRDGWGRELRMRCPGRKHPDGADVVSAGPSGTFEDTDQIE